MFFLHNIAGRVFTIGPDRDGAYAIVEVDCATSLHTFVHEVGHLFGARHNISADDTPGDAHGHNWKKGVWPLREDLKTIMSVRQNHDRITYFSNPSVSYEGKPTGVTGVSDNRKTINANGQIVSEFKYSQPSLAVYIYGPGLSDGGDLLGFTTSVANGQSPYSYQWYVDIGDGFYHSYTTSSIALTMPNDNNLEVRVTVTDANGNQATDYHFVQNSFLNGGCTVCPDSRVNDSKTETLNDGNSLSAKRLALFPNPANNYLQVLAPLSNLNNATISIIDSKGALVLVKEGLSSNSVLFNISQFRKGIYIIKYVNNKEIQFVRFVKE